jgi:hypothetical protein
VCVCVCVCVQMQYWHVRGRTPLSGVGLGSHERWGLVINGPSSPVFRAGMVVHSTRITRIHMTYRQVSSSSALAQHAHTLDIHGRYRRTLDFCLVRLSQILMYCSCMCVCVCVYVCVCACVCVCVCIWIYGDLEIEMCGSVRARERERE